MFEGIKFVSIKRLKVHEADTTLRRMHPDEQQWSNKAVLFGEIQKEAIGMFIKILGQLLATYLIASSLRDGNQISLSFQGIKASVPAAYFFLVISFLLFITSISFNHLSAAMTLKSNLAPKMNLHGFSVPTYDLFKNKGEFSFGISLFNNPFLKELVPVSSLLGYIALVVIMSALIPIFALGAYVFSEQVILAFQSNALIIEKISACFGAIVTLLSGLYVLLFHIPLPVRKNRFSIRWGFLYRLAPHTSDEEKFKRWREITVEDK